MAKVFSPAKINLFFAATGLRSDGYHEIFSANCLLNFGDEMELTFSDKSRDEILCESDFLDLKNNTIATALQLFRTTTAIDKFYRVKLKKNIPHMSGFGGGSSNAAAVLRAINAMNDEVLSTENLSQLLKKIGADCPFFLEKFPAIITGIGEHSSRIGENFERALNNYNIFIFKPKFGISTKLAYANLRENFRSLYLSQKAAAEKFSQLRDAILSEKIDLPLYNTFAEVFFKKFPQFAKLQKQLCAIGANASLTGSGSGFFCITHRSVDAFAARKVVAEIIGEGEFLQETSFNLPAKGRC